MTAAEFARWRLEHKLVTDLLAQVEHAERAILTALHCPTDPVRIYAILNGEQRAPWPKRTADRAKRRALHAMHVLVRLAQVRQHIGLKNPNAQRAAYAALVAGLYANDAAANAVIAERPRKGGRTRGAQVAQQAAQHDATLRRHYRYWQQSEELQYEFTTPTEYLCAQTGLSRATVYRRLHVINQSQ